MNPLLLSFDTPCGVPPFDSIDETHFEEGFVEAIRIAKKEIDAVTQCRDAPTFENTIQALENCGRLLDQISAIFFNLNSAKTNSNIQKIAQKIAPMLAHHNNDLLLNQALFNRIDVVWKRRDDIGLTGEDFRLLEHTYKSFKRNGALLNMEQKAELRRIDQELSKLSLQFGEHVLADTKEFQLVIDREEDLHGLPQSLIATARALAQTLSMEDKWVFTLDAPSYLPFVTYASNRALREKMFLAYGSRCFNGGKNDNRQTLLRIVTLRRRRAILLGYPTYAHFVLEERMARRPEQVKEFLSDILSYSLSVGEMEITLLQQYARDMDGIESLRQWDYYYYSEKLKKEKYNIDDEVLKPYFQLNEVVQGVFDVAFKLYGITFQERKDIPVYHPEVTAYEVLDKEEKMIAVFYTDFFPRPGKRNGAWMTQYRNQYTHEGENIRPIVSIVCNFSRPTLEHPSLLTFNEVTTLFHEFGHALHGIFADTHYASLSGINVYWDFVELPSQIMENWCREKECLDLFARHYETGESIPPEYIQKLKESATFHEGWITTRQVSLAMLDLSWHMNEVDECTNVSEFEEEAMSDAMLLPYNHATNMSCAFTHIFQGGYAAAYYSYKWAEVLDADAFELFRQEGLYDSNVASGFRTLLAAGGTIDPMTLYHQFRGRAPRIEPLLVRAGLMEPIEIK